MAMKGAESKEIITKKILSMFEGSFINEKNIIIPLNESGEPVQIKVTLTASKNLIQNGSDTAIPGVINFTADKPAAATSVASTATAAVNTDPPAPTEEEKQAVKKMMEALGL